MGLCPTKTLMADGLVRQTNTRIFNLTITKKPYTDHGRFTVIRRIAVG
jgi:hypothetical protein